MRILCSWNICIFFVCWNKFYFFRKDSKHKDHKEKERFREKEKERERQKIKSRRESEDTKADAKESREKERERIYEETKKKLAEHRYRCYAYSHISHFSKYHIKIMIFLELMYCTTAWYILKFKILCDSDYLYK